MDEESSGTVTRVAAGDAAVENASPSDGESRHPERSAEGARDASLHCHPERSAEGERGTSQPRHPERSAKGERGTSQPCHPERSAEGAESKDLPGDGSTTPTPRPYEAPRAVISPDVPFREAVRAMRERGDLGPAAVIREWDGQRRAYRVAKRAFDVCFSAAVLAVIAVPSLVLAAAIRIESPGNPFYGQERVGRLNPDGTVSTFRMWKFRSMYRDADERLKDLLDQNEVKGAMFKMRDDPRVTRIGRFIRKHSIDEFPQFLNVLLGQMSVVGPRPPLPRELPMYRPSDFQRLAVKPGITGLWQVMERNDTDFDGMVRWDLRYIARRSVAEDLRIVLLTVGEVFKGEGAS